MDEPRCESELSDSSDGASERPLRGRRQARLVRRNFLEAEGLQPMWAASHWIDSCWLVAPLRGQRSYPPGYGAN